MVEEVGGFSSSAASDHHHLTTATPSPPVAPPRRHSVVPSTSGFITGYTSRAYIPIERSVSPPLIPVAKAPFWNRKRVAAVVALWLTAFVGWSWWSTSGDEQVVGSYRWSHRNGSNVDVFKDWNISAPDGSATATFIGLGATLTNFYVRDKAGKQRDVVLGYDDRTQYLLDPAFPYFGAVVGRYANRIRNSSFSLPPSSNLAHLPPGAKIHHTTPNEHLGLNTLHGGRAGYSRSGWSLLSHHSDRLVFGLLDRAGTEGFPGTVYVTASYTLSNNAVWTTRLEASVKDGGTGGEEETPIMLSSHVYWNLDGFDSGEGISAMNHSLSVRASSWIETDGILVPTGDITSIPIPSSSHPLDFSVPRQIGERLEATKKLGLCGPDCTGYDTCLVYDPHIIDSTVLSLSSPSSGISMTTSTNQPAVQLYTCNGQDGSTPRKASHRHGNEIAQGYGQHDCVVIEQQGRIGGINNPEWGENQVYGPGKKYEWWSEYRFGVNL